MAKNSQGDKVIPNGSITPTKARSLPPISPRTPLDSALGHSDGNISPSSKRKKRKRKRKQETEQSLDMPP